VFVIAVASLGYWIVALFVLGLITVLHGDCFADMACVAEKRMITKVGLAIGGVGFIAFIVFLHRSQR
jgi:hypothetical protein